MGKLMPLVRFNFTILSGYINFIQNLVRQVCLARLTNRHLLEQVFWNKLNVFFEGLLNSSCSHKPLCWIFFTGCSLNKMQFRGSWIEQGEYLKHPSLDLIYFHKFNINWINSALNIFAYRFNDVEVNGVFFTHNICNIGVFQDSGNAVKATQSLASSKLVQTWMVWRRVSRMGNAHYCEQYP